MSTINLRICVCISLLLLSLHPGKCWISPIFSLNSKTSQYKYNIDINWKPIDFNNDLILLSDALIILKSDKLKSSIVKPVDITIETARGRKSLLKEVIPKFIITPTVMYIVLKVILNIILRNKALSAAATGEGERRTARRRAI